MNYATYSLPARLLHWLMALLILAMLFIGVGMVSSLGPWQHRLVSLHKGVGLVLLGLMLLRVVMRLRQSPPALPANIPAWQQRLAHSAHGLLYGLMLALPLLGWAMQSAGGYPLVVLGWTLPAIAPQDVDLYAGLRRAHGWLAYLLFASILLHVAGALFHGLIRRDGVLASMLRGRAR
ncbi:cytochrome b [Pseudomonas sp. NPDC079086]|jgi:cytochrome b561|uniref:cytochrome b n=1 Tax=unclassified Pseudomonas TaxID=196821 RepID=UPI0037C7EF1A